MHANLPSRVQVGAQTPSLTLAPDTDGLGPNAPAHRVGECLTAERLDAQIEYHAERVQRFMKRASAATTEDERFYCRAEANRHDILLGALKAMRGQECN